MVSIENKKFLDSLTNSKLSDQQKSKKIISYLSETYPNNGTHAKKLSLFKSHCRSSDVFFDPDNSKLITNQGIFDAVNQDRENKQLPCKMHVPMSFLLDLQSFENSHNKYELYIYLLYQSGRRPNELCDNIMNDNFHLRDGNLMCDYLAKKRNVKKPLNGYPIVLESCENKCFIDLAARFKMLITNSKGHLTTSKSISDRSRAILASLSAKHGLNRNIKVKDLRPLYIETMKQKSMYKNMNSAQLIKNLLCHESRDVSVYYNDKFIIL